MKLLSSLIRCPVCREQATSALGCCDDCANDLFQPYHSETLVYLGTYAGRLERAVRAYKFHHTTQLGKLFAKELAKVIEPWKIDILCAVPLHWSRYLERGYNQSALLARHLSKELDLPYQTLLKRTKRTKQQAKLSKAERQSNVTEAFVAKNVRGSILLVDDVITSGATSQACIDALLKAGASAVKLAAIARAK